MALLICPECKAYGFTWTIDEEESPLTRWGCIVCGYMAWEDESLCRVCTGCGWKTENMLDDGEKRYWWCSRCNTVKPVALQ